MAGEWRECGLAGKPKICQSEHYIRAGRDGGPDLTMGEEIRRCRHPAVCVNVHPSICNACPVPALVAAVRLSPPNDPECYKHSDCKECLHVSADGMVCNSPYLEARKAALALLPKEE